MYPVRLYSASIYHFYYSKNLLLNLYKGQLVIFVYTIVCFAQLSLSTTALILKPTVKMPILSPKFTP